MSENDGGPAVGDPPAPPVGQQYRGRWRWIVALAAVVVTVVALTAALVTRGRRSVSPLAHGTSTSTVVGPEGATVTFPGGWVDIPAGVVNSRRTVHITTAGRTPPPGPPGLMRPLAPAVDVDLGGVQPAKPLKVGLSVGTGLPYGARPEQLFVATVPSGDTSPRLSPSSYDSNRNAVVGEVGHLSLFWPVQLDVGELVKTFVGFLGKELKVRVPKPACAAEPVSVQLADGQVSFADTGWESGPDPPLWGCLSTSPDDPGHVTVELTNNRPMAYAIQVPDGASFSREPPSVDSTTMSLLFQAAAGGNTGGQQLFTGGSTARIVVPISSQTPVATPFVVAAVQAQQAVVAASAAQTAFLLTEELVTHGWHPEALRQALNAQDNLDCVLGAVSIPAPAPLNQLVDGAEIGLRCLGPVLGAIAGEAVAILSLIRSFLGTFTSMFDFVLAQLTGTGLTTVSLRRTVSTPTPAPSSGPPPPAGSPPAPAPAPDPRLQDLQIRRVWTTDDTGGEKTAFRCGDPVRYTVLVANPNHTAMYARITFDVGNRDRTLYGYTQEVEVPAADAGYYSPSAIPSDFPAGYAAEYDLVVVVGWCGHATCRPGDVYTQSSLGSAFTVRC